ncbi:MAG: hypothetical protein MUC92_13215 [Fimbriimonadaceae bacterium]|jgi:ankyrin repeat protein|nr:hypothetical protein [Fimbriimonadaceae bacterium]
MKRQLPENPNLEFLKTQAKELLRELRTSSPLTKLHMAQHQLAMEYGFASWPKLVSSIQDSQLASASLAASVALIESGLLNPRDGKRAARLLTLRPELAAESLTCALMALDLDQVRRQFQGHEPTGSQGLEPIVYAAFSPLARSKPKEYKEVLSYLLERGANPNGFLLLPSQPDSPLSVLYGAVGLADDPEVCEMLLAAGANPNDNESLYHSCESRNHQCTRLLLQHGAKIDGCNALLRMLDYEDLEGLEILLSHKPDLMNPNALLHALRRGRSDAILEHLVGAGADPLAEDETGTSAAQVAFERGRPIPALLKDFQPSGPDQLLAACWRGDVAEARRLRSYGSDLSLLRRKAFPDACWLNQYQAIDAFIAAGFSVMERDDSKGTPLHAACFAGYPKVVSALLAHNPPLDDANDYYQAIPLQWAMYASEQAEDHPGIEVRDWVGCVELLLEAGSPPPVSLFGSGEVQDLVLAKWPDLASKAGE